MIHTKRGTRGRVEGQRTDNRVLEEPGRARGDLPEVAPRENDDDGRGGRPDRLFVLRAVIHALEEATKTLETWYREEETPWHDDVG